MTNRDWLQGSLPCSLYPWLIIHFFPILGSNMASRPVGSFNIASSGPTSGYVEMSKDWMARKATIRTIGRRCGRENRTLMCEDNPK